MLWTYIIVKLCPKKGDHSNSKLGHLICIGYSKSDNSLKDNFLLNESNNNLLSEIEVLESDIPVTPLPPKRARKLKKLRQSSIYEYCY